MLSAVALSHFPKQAKLKISDYKVDFYLNYLIGQNF